jgi:Trp operon repressor
LQLASPTQVTSNLVPAEASMLLETHAEGAKQDTFKTLLTLPITRNEEHACGAAQNISQSVLFGQINTVSKQDKLATHFRLQ